MSKADYNPLGIYEPSRARPEPVKVRANDGVAFSARSLGGGRATIDTEADIFSSAFSILAPLSSDETWRQGGLDSRTLDRIPINRLVELLADLSPHVSKALWDFLRFANAGYEIKVYKPGSDVAYEEGQKALDAFLGQLHGPYTINNVVPLDVIIGSMYIAIFLRGALCTELVLDKTGKLPLEIATPDPATIKAKRVMDDERGLVWQLGQWQRGGNFVPIDKPTVAYVPIDPLPGKWHGRALAAPAVFSCLFLIGLLHDLRRVVAQQGYPRFHVKIDFEKLIAMMPKNLGSDPLATKKWVEACERQVTEAYSRLQPDDTFVSADYVEIAGPKGTLDASSLKGSEGLISALERFTVQSLKTMPFLMGINESTTETLANRQWEACIGGIKAVQHVPEFVLGRQFELALRVQGILAKVVVRFAENRASEMMRDAQTERLRIDNAARKRDEGFITQDEAAMEITGKKAALPQPIVRRTSGVSDPTAIANPEPGANRSIEEFERIN